MGFMTPDNFVSDSIQVMPDATLFHFGMLESSVHMAWMRVVCGRLKSDYNYSASVVYNNFPWCAFSDRIEQTAAKILEVRSKFGDRSLADLYDEKKMPDELRAVHAENDRAVMDAYGFEHDLDEPTIVSRLMSMYHRLTAKK